MKNVSARTLILFPFEAPGAVGPPKKQVLLCKKPWAQPSGSLEKISLPADYKSSSTARSSVPCLAAAAGKELRSYKPPSALSSTMDFRKSCETACPTAGCDCCLQTLRPPVLGGVALNTHCPRRSSNRGSSARRSPPAFLGPVLKRVLLP